MLGLSLLLPTERYLTGQDLFLVQWFSSSAESPRVPWQWKFTPPCSWLWVWCWFKASCDKAEQWDVGVSVSGSVKQGLTLTVSQDVQDVG